MKIYNNNPAFGDCGPFVIDAPTFRLACFELANEMETSFKMWAEEQGEVEVENGIPYEHVERSRDERIAEMRREFLKGLTAVIRCNECGQDYHADAPERGHASECGKRFEKVAP